jgi:xylose isomerase
MLEDDRLEAARRERYAGWNEPWAQAMLASGATLDGIAADAEARGLDPQPVSGRQERLENLVNRYV